MKEEKIKMVKILGAGISGLSAAITLARNGLNVEIFEKSSHAGGRFTREFQCLRNFGWTYIDPIMEFKELGISIKPIKKLTRIIRYSRSYSFEVVSDLKPIYYIVLRGKDENSIDVQLEKIALQYGIKIHYNTTIPRNKVNIVATGPSKADFVAYGERFEDMNIDDTGYVFLDTRYSPKGYLYILPGEKKGEGEIVNSSVDPTVSMQKIKLLYTRALQENSILKDFVYGATRKSIQKGIASSTKVDDLCQQQRYYVGEAAGFQDLAAGFGIRYAILSGCLAAGSILTGKPYSEQWSKTFMSQLEFERKRSQNIERLTNDDLDRIFQSINEKFGRIISLSEYESMRGVI